MSVKVDVHIKENDSGIGWSGHKECEFTRVPTVGEYISFDLNNSPGYRVTLVNHYAFDRDAAAEIFVQPTDFDDVHKAAGF